MYKREVEDFCEYQIIGNVEGEETVICCCKYAAIAEALTRILAEADPDHDAYYFTGITNPGDFVVGGGWHVCYQKDENGKVHRSELS